MDSSQHAFHYHLARAFLHLNQLASFLPSFEIPADWDATSGVPRPYPHHQPFHPSRQLHRFVPLPTEPRPPPSLASHGDLPPHFLMNPEQHFHPVTHRDTHPTAHNIHRETTYEDIHMVEDLPRSYECVTVPPRVPNKHLGPLLHVLSRTLRTLHRFGLQNALARPQVEHVNRFGSPTRDGVSSSTHPSRPAPADPSGPPPSSVRHTSL